MDKKKNIDLVIAILCGLVALIALYGMEDAPIGIYIAVCAGSGLIAFLAFYLTAVAKERAVQETPVPEGGAITELLLLNEEEKPIAAWDMFGKTALVIGKDIKENHVDINLNQSVYASMIDIEHAVLNYADNHWYIEDLGSKNGVVLQKKADDRKYKLAADQPCKLDAGDVIIVGLTKLLAR
ncbi:FHA domain-containing protein [Pelosinus fermentans]|uniref:Forkhead-associated protein n=1 Tax=Pelosinus fermentans JBW45 TaxID=1192197 RepID=I9DBP7_9FIRM|nr:FHA domain-containing protein [Pelosinus fermentans]AJQ29504.1 Forkhead-associated protein [Pelosinus fermentans JBW45]